jgi:hypothetical protein
MDFLKGLQVAAVGYLLLSTYIMLEVSELLFASCFLFGLSLYILYQAALYAVKISDLKTRRRNNLLFKDRMINKFRFYMWGNIVVAALVVYYCMDLIDVVISLG